MVDSFLFLIFMSSFLVQFALSCAVMNVFIFPFLLGIGIPSVSFVQPV
jgi:hypothetical protein